MASVDVISSCFIGMAKNGGLMSRMELTPWDLQFIPLGPNQKGMLYHHPLSPPIIHHLKKSLSRTLDFFPPLSGRLASADNSFFIDCNDAGVLFVHAIARGVSVSDILDATYTPDIVELLLEFRSLRSTMATSLGAAVITSWMELLSGTSSTLGLRFLELEIPKFQISSTPLLERVFYISKQNLAKLKAKANSEARNDVVISSLQALSAHLWRSYARCQQSEGDDECSLTMAIGARRRIPLPEGYFGKAIYPAAMAVDRAELVQKGLGFAAVKVNELISEQSSEKAIKVVEDWAKNPTFRRKERLGLSITGSLVFDVYGNDFGWGKPVGARSARTEKYDGRITLFQAAVAGGFDVEVCFAPETLHALEDDAEFMEAFTL